MVGLGLVQQALSGPRPNITALVPLCSLQNCPSFTHTKGRPEVQNCRQERSRGEISSVSSEIQSPCHVSPPVCLYLVKPPLSGQSCSPEENNTQTLNTRLRRSGQPKSNYRVCFVCVSSFCPKKNPCMCACFIHTGIHAHTHLPPHPHRHTHSF